jgi:uncharacterized protein YdaU (DUF1376 family)
MSERAPAFSFYAKDFLLGTVTLSLAAKGAYITLLAYQWDNGSVPKDAEARQRILGCTKREAETLWESLGSKFEPGPDGQLRNGRLEMERAKQAERRATLTANGQKGGRPKNQNGTNRLSVAKPITNQNESLPSPFPEDPPVSPPSGNYRTSLEPLESMRWFDRVYGAYPNKDRKQAANEVWRELGPDLKLAQEILSDIQRRVKNGWVKYERRSIPQLVRYLRERQWEDASSGNAGVLEDDPHALLPHAWQCMTCGEIHEGTAAQHKAGACLKVEAAVR